MKAPGRHFLMISGILYTLFFTLMLVSFSLIALVIFQSGLSTTELASVMVADLGYDFLPYVDMLFSFFTVVMVAGFALSIIGLIFGILAIALRNKLKAALFLFILGMFSLVMDAITLVFVLFSGDLFGIIFSSVLFLLPLFYVIGAGLNRRAYKKQLKNG